MQSFENESAHEGVVRILGDRRQWLDSLEPMVRRIVERGCHYGGRSIVKVLSPKFLTRGQYEYLAYVSGIIMGAFRRLAERALNEPLLQDYLALTPQDRRLLVPEPRCPDPCAIARLDAFQTEDGLKFVELNGEAPAGVGYGDAALEVLREHPVFQRIEQELDARPVPLFEGLLNGLLCAWRAGGGTRRPRILITDYLDLPTVPEFYLIRDYLERAGFEAVVEDVRHLDFHEGRLYAQGAPVDLVYRRVITAEFLERWDEVQALWRAYEAQSVVLVDPFRAKLVHKKSAFGLLTGELIGQEWLTHEERQVIARHMPWTRRLKEGWTTTEDGERIDLLEYVRAHREDLVIKPSDEYGGAGVIVGWTVDQGRWEQGIAECSPHDFVVQRRAVMREELFPVMERELEDQSMIVDLDPYMYFGRMHGVLARLAAGALCNVSSGGGQVPVYVREGV